MHEQWKKRKMFSNREQGIMSGLDPVPMMAGGSVPYPGMETGGVVPQTQLFEEGDNELNASLNMMASVSNPDVPDMPMPMMDEKVKVKEEATMDQGPDGFRMAVDDLKATFKSEIDNYISKAGVENIGKYLKSMSVAYNNQLNNLRKQFKVDKVDPEDQLFTEQFLAEFMTDVPGMQSGGVVLTQEQLDELFGEGRFPLEEWNKYSPDIQEFLLRKSQIAKLEQDQATAGSQIDLSKLEELQTERRALAPQIGAAARAGVATVGSPSGRYLAGLTAGKQAETAALDKALVGEIDIQKAILNAQARAGTPVGGLDIGFTADEAEAFSLQNITKERLAKERLDKQWDAAIKAEKGDFAKAFIAFWGQTGGKIPVEYQGQIRDIPGLGKEGDLSDYYMYLLNFKENGKPLSPSQIRASLQKWNTFQVVS